MCRSLTDSLRQPGLVRPRPSRDAARGGNHSGDASIRCAASGRHKAPCRKFFCAAEAGLEAEKLVNDRSGALLCRVGQCLGIPQSIGLKLTGCVQHRVGDRADM
jgi:hypothetical protein